MKLRYFVRSIIAAIVLVVCGGSMTVLVPFLLGSLVDDLRLSVAQATDIVASGAAGLLFGTIAVLIKECHSNRKLFAIIASAFMIIGNLLGFIFKLHSSLIFSQFLVGFGAGCFIAIGVAIIAGTDNSSRYIGLQMMAATLVSSINLLVVPVAISMMGLNGYFVVLMVFSILAIFVIQWLPTKILLTDASMLCGSNAGFAFSRSMIFAIASTLIVFTGFNAFWPFIERISLDGGIGNNLISKSLSSAMIAAAVVGLLAGKIGNKYGYYKPVIFSCMAMFICLLLVFNFLTSNSIVFIIPVFQAHFIMLLIYNNAYLASLDPLGKVLLLGVIMENTGAVLGPIISGQILRFGGGYYAIGTFFTVMLFLYVLFKVFSYLSESGPVTSTKNLARLKC